MIHEITGESFYYAPLAKRLAPFCPVYGVDLVGAGYELSGLTIQKLASLHVDAIKIKQAHGPYRLAGWSSGGLIAIEVAYQILASGEEVDFVGLIETPRGSSRKEVEPNNLRRLEEHPNKFNGSIEVPENSIHALFTDSDMRNELAVEYFGVEFDFLPFLQFADDLTSTPLFNDEVSARMIKAPELDSIFNLIYEERGWSRLRVIDKLNVCALFHGDIESTYYPPRLTVPVTLFYSNDIDEEETSIPPKPIGFSDVKDLETEKSIYLKAEWRTLLDENLSCVFTSGNHMTLLQPPHVDILAEGIVKVLDGLPGSDKESQCSFTPLVKFSQDKSETPKLICIPGSAAGVSPFIDLGLKLGDTMQLIVAQQRGLDLVTVPYISVEQAVEDYMSAILKENCDGPIHILGHSFGAWIAFELACRMQHQSMKMGSLTLIEPHMPSLFVEGPKYKTRSDIVLRFIELIFENTESEMKIERESILVLTEDEQINLVGTLLRDSDHHKRNIEDDMVRQLVNVFILNAQNEYTPKSALSIPSQIIFAKKRSRFEQIPMQENLDVWKTFLPNSDVKTIDANHMSILKNKNSGEILKFVFDIAK